MTRFVRLLTAAFFAVLVGVMFAGSAHAAPAPPVPPTVPSIGSGGLDGNFTISVPDLQNTGGGNAIVIVLVLTVLSVAPALLVMLTSFTRIVITFSLARQALGSPSVPPNQVIVGISLLLSFVVMAPTFSKINDAALQPLLADKITISEAIDRAEDPMRTFLLKNTRDSELSSMRKIAGENPDAAVSTTGFVPLATAFVLSELRTAFTLGFLIYVPFLIIDLVVASILMSLGLMFLPPSFVSLPIKLLLFILLGGWTLIAETVVRSFA